MYYIDLTGGRVMKIYVALLLTAMSGIAVAAEPAAEPEQPGTTSYVKCCIAPGGDGTSERPYSSISEAEGDPSWTTLVVLPSKPDLDKLASDTAAQQRNPDGSVNTTRAIKPKIGKMVTVSTPSGRTLMQMEGNNPINNCVCPADGDTAQ